MNHVCWLGRLGGDPGTRFGADGTEFASGRGPQDVRFPGTRFKGAAMSTVGGRAQAP